MQSSKLIQVTDIRKGKMKDDPAMGGAIEVPLSGHEAELRTISKSIEFLERTANIQQGFIEGFLGSKMLVKKSEFEAVSASYDWKPVCAKVEKIEDEIKRVESRQSELSSQLFEISKWENLGVPLSEIGETRRSMSVVGIIPAQEKDTPAILEKLNSEMHCRQVWAENGKIGVIAVYAASNFEKCEESLKNAGFAPVALPKINETPSALALKWKTELEAAKAEKTAKLKEAGQYFAELANLKIIYDSILIKKVRIDVVSNFAGTVHTAIIEGWIRKSDADKIPQILEGLPVHAYTRPPEEGENPPIDTENNPIIKPFEVVFRLYGRPAYFEIDPTPILTSFFFIFFGLCMGDVGYGITLCVFSLFILWKYKPVEGMKLLFQLFFIGGIATIIAGFVFGSFFGLAIKPLWFSMNDDPIRFLMLALALGIIHIFSGIITKMYLNIKDGHVLDAIFDQGFWLIALSGLVSFGVGSSAGFALAATVGKYLAIAGAAGLVLTQGRSKKGIAGKAVSGVLSLYNVVGYLSDVLSYSRLLALGLATGIIAMVFNTLGMMVVGDSPTALNIIIAAVILIVCHVFNFLLGIMGAFVHTSRLQFVEFFNKFYTGGGRRFEPFRQATRYTTVKE
jgi:V/A-type H+-transporting ATPase subunit I